MPISVEGRKMVARKRSGSQSLEASVQLSSSLMESLIKRYECFGLRYIMADHPVRRHAGSRSSAAGTVIGYSVWLTRSGWTSWGQREYLQSLRRSVALCNVLFQKTAPWLLRELGREEITLKTLYTGTQPVFFFLLQKDGNPGQSSL